MVAGGDFIAAWFVPRVANNASAHEPLEGRLVMLTPPAESARVVGGNMCMAAVKNAAISFQSTTCSIRFSYTTCPPPGAGGGWAGGGLT